MIQSAMMFALGFFVSGLAWLAFSVALVRRAKRLTERRLLAGIATRRAEFEAERDELRARHAVEMHRQEREVSRVLDMATAHRLEADLRERDLVSARAELAAREEDLHEMQARLTLQRDQLQDLERRHAEAGTELRAVQHALNLEMRRRALAEEALDGASILADQRRLELAALRAREDAASAGDEMPFEQVGAARPRILREPLGGEAAAQQGGSVVPMTRRARSSPPPPEQAEALVSEAARELQRMAGEAHGDIGTGVWRAPAQGEARQPAATAEASIVAELDTRRSAPATADAPAHADAEENAETRFFEALAEIRALKRAASQAGE